MLDAEQPGEAAAQQIRRGNDRQRSERVGGFAGPDFVDERQFQIGVERTGDDPKHRWKV